jgi:hypothetical protein
MGHAALRNLPGYDPNVASSRLQARKIMEKWATGLTRDWR